MTPSQRRPFHSKSEACNERTLATPTAAGSGRGIYRRPCLCLTRDDTEAYCAALGQNYVQDETNAADLYARNRIRHTVVPALQSVNPAAEQAIAKSVFSRSKRYLLFRTKRSMK